MLPLFLALLLATQVFCSVPRTTRILRIGEGYCGDTPMQLWFREDYAQASFTFIQEVWPGDCVTVPKLRADWHRTFCPETGRWSGYATENPDGECG